MRVQLLPNVTAITSAQQASVRFPLGPTYHRVQLRWGATADPGLAGMTGIAVVVDGNKIMEWADASDLDALNKFHGRPAITGGGTVADPYEMTIYFRRPEINSFLGRLHEVAAETVTSLRTGKNVVSAQIEFTITGAGAFCTAFGDVDEIEGEDIEKGAIVRIKRFPQDLAAGDQDVLYDIPRGDGRASLIAAHFKASDITHINQLKVGSLIVYNATTKEALQKFQKDDGKVPVAGWTVLDQTSNGSLDGILRLHPQIEPRASIRKTAAGSAPLYAEYLDNIRSGM